MRQWLGGKTVSIIVLSEDTGRWMENPYEYVKEVQALHNDSKIKFSNEYYDTLGLERPDGSECEAQYTAFTSVIVAVAKGKS